MGFYEQIEDKYITIKRHVQEINFKLNWGETGEDVVSNTYLVKKAGEVEDMSTMIELLVDEVEKRRIGIFGMNEQIKMQLLSAVKRTGKEVKELDTRISGIVKERTENTEGTDKELASDGESSLEPPQELSGIDRR